MKQALAVPNIVTLAMASGIAFSSAVFAQEFADDFSTDSLKYQIRTNISETGSGGYTPGTDTLILSLENADSSASDIQVESPTRSIGMAGRFDTAQTSMAQTSFAAVSVQTAVFNDTPAADSTSDVGDIYLNVFNLISGTDSNLRICLGRVDTDGFKDLPIFDDGHNCRDYNDIAPALGEEFSIGLAVQEPNLVNLNLNGTQETLEIPGSLRAPVNLNGGLRLEQSGQGKSSFLVSGITTDSGEDDFSQELPVFNRYRLGYTNVTPAPAVVDERVQINRTSEDGTSSFTTIEFTDVTDYMEATVLLDSSTRLEGDNPRAGVGANLEFVFANDTQDGGTDGRLGDLRANVDIDARQNGLRRAEYCLYRFEDVEGNNRRGLLYNGEERCQEFPIWLEFDTPYRMAIAVDRANASVTFRVNGERYTETLPFALFDAAQPSSRINMFAYDGGTLLGYVDDVKNSSTALTATELADGAVGPAEFPTEPSDEERRVDSSLDAPLDYAANVNYIDDFELGTTAIGISRHPRESAQSAVGHFDGALEIQTTSNDPEESASTELRINAPGDTIKVVASLSDRSMIQPGRTEVGFDFETVLINDTRDGGFNGREGDVQAKIRIKLDSNGRRRIQAELRRRDGNDDRIDLGLFEGDDRYVFDLIPELNTPYELGISVDRTQNTVTFSVDDLSHTVQLPFQAYQPAERDINFRTWFQGPSGRSVARIHSFAVGDYVQDFTAPPVIAPYAPAWNARHDGIDIEYLDGRVKLSADARITDRIANIESQGLPEVVAADIELSSESIISTDGAIAVGLSGILYHGTPPTDLNDRTDAVFVTLRLSANGAGERFVQTCAYSSTDDSFSSSRELITGNENSDGFDCRRMTIVPDLDTVYPASIALDKDASTLTFRFADEEFVYNISGEIHPPARSFSGARARATDDSKVVSFVDNLAYAANPVPIAQSDSSIGRDITDEVNAGSNSANAPDSNESSSGGGGALQLPLVLLTLLLLVGYRRRSGLCNS